MTSFIRLVGDNQTVVGKHLKVVIFLLQQDKLFSQRFRNTHTSYCVCTDLAAGVVLGALEIWQFEVRRKPNPLCRFLTREELMRVSRVNNSLASHQRQPRHCKGFGGGHFRPHTVTSKDNQAIISKHF